PEVVSVGSARPPDGQPVQTLLVPAPGQEITTPGMDRPAGNLLYKFFFAQLISNLAAMVLGPLVVLLALRYVLRRYGGDLEALLRAGFAGAMPRVELATPAGVPAPLPELDPND